MTPPVTGWTTPWPYCCASERDRRLAPIDGYDVTAGQQSGLIAALSVLQKER